LALRGVDLAKPSIPLKDMTIRSPFSVDRTGEDVEGAAALLLQAPTAPFCLAVEWRGVYPPSG